MSIQVNRDSKLIKVLAAQARHERIDSAAVEEAAQIINELAQDLSPQNRYQIAQTVAFTVDELQQHELDFLNRVADVKNVGYGDKAVFNVKTGNIKAYIQAKGSTTARSHIGGKQIMVETQEISARPAINIIDLRSGRVNMADLIREANHEITNKKLAAVEKVLHAAIDDYSSPFYGTGSGITAATLDAQLAYFNRLGPVTILGDLAAVGQLSELAGMAMSSTQNQFSDAMINERNENGYIGRYKGCEVLAMNNAYEGGSITPVLATDWLYIVPGNASADSRNLKLVNEGSVSTIDSQNIDDKTFEVCLDQWLTLMLQRITKPLRTVMCVTNIA